ncbi:MAG: glycerate kinase [Francisella endosymbiont of Hyalomma asiaticum]
MDLSSLNSALNTLVLKLLVMLINSLYDINDAILTFGKQKGVADKQLKDIDDKIRSVAKLSQKITNKNLDNLFKYWSCWRCWFCSCNIYKFSISLRH